MVDIPLQTDFSRDPANYDVYHVGLHVATFYSVFCISYGMIFSVLQDKLIRSREYDEQPQNVVDKLTIVFSCIF